MYQTIVQSSITNTSANTIHVSRIKREPSQHKLSSGDEKTHGSMADNIESWSRTRRASAHSITMSSSTGSRASSIGPSSFTENLTLYMNGGREYVHPAAATPTIESPNRPGSAQAGHPRDDPCDMQTLKDELQAALNRHEELMSENARLSEELKHSIESTKTKNDREEDNVEAGFGLISHKDYDQVVAHNIQLKRQIEEQTADQSQSHELRSQLKQAFQAAEEADLKVEATQNQADAHLLRVQELERQIEDQAELLKKSRDRESDSRRQIQRLQQEVESSESNGRDELDDQSLIEELEDDLERTRLELERVIKDKRRAERQVEFLQSDLKFERSRNEELVGQIVKARDRTTAVPGDISPKVAGGEGTPETNSELRHLSGEIERASVRIASLEAKLADRMTTEQNYNDHAQISAQRTVAPVDCPMNEEDTTAVKRAEAYIRKFKTQEKALKADLQDAQSERDDLRLQLREREDAHRASLSVIKELKGEIKGLEAVKERMGRVLMYQWGKDEVGEVERARKDGGKERGMGYRYKFFNKDGTVKQIT